MRYVSLLAALLVFGHVSAQIYALDTLKGSAEREMAANYDLVIQLTQNEEDNDSIVSEFIKGGSAQNYKRVAIFCHESIHEIPKPFFQMVWIESLMLYGTESFNDWMKDEVGNHFSHLANLQSLVIANLPIDKFNEHLVLNQLQTLYLVNTNLSRFPKFLYGSPSLTTLVIAGAPLVTIPSEIGTLEHLEVFEVSAAPINHLPTAVFALHNLTALALNDTDINEIPDEVVNLKKLEVLTFSSASGTIKCSPNLCHLPSLKTFSNNMPTSGKPLCFSNPLEWEKNGGLYKRKH